MRVHLAYRSSAASRVRIALALKGIEYEPVVYQPGGTGFRHYGEYMKLNPQGLVPAVEHERRVLVQSVAIIEYLDEVKPNPPLLPNDPVERARVRGLANIVTSDIHPLENGGTLRYFRERWNHDEAAAYEWFNHWIAKGFRALEATLSSSKETGRFCHGDTPTLADVVLVPQVFNSFRHKADPLTQFPTIERIYNAALEIPAFKYGLPDGKVPPPL